MKDFITTIISINGGRNHAIHGFWGWEHREGKEPKSAAYSHKADKPLYADEISGIADRIAVATRKAHSAMMELQGVKGEIRGDGGH